jgi:hypothetical protein
MAVRAQDVTVPPAEQRGRSDELFLRTVPAEALFALRAIAIMAWREADA